MSVWCEDISDEELARRVDAHIDAMYKTGRIPDRFIPARPCEDFDLLVAELIRRFLQKKEVQK